LLGGVGISYDLCFCLINIKLIVNHDKNKEKQEKTQQKLI